MAQLSLEIYKLLTADSKLPSHTFHLTFIRDFSFGTFVIHDGSMSLGPYDWLIQLPGHNSDSQNVLIPCSSRSRDYLEILDCTFVALELYWTERW